MPEISKELADRAARSQLVRKLGIDPIAFARKLGNANVPTGRRPESHTHMLAWFHGAASDENLYGQETIDLLLDYIMMLEEQLKVERQAFRDNSIQILVSNTDLNGFDLPAR